MVRKIHILLFVIFCFNRATFCYGLNWRSLHEEADIRGLSGALAAVAQKPGSIDDLYILGLVYLNMHKDKDAESIFNKILSLDPDAIEARWGVAEVLRRQHDLDKAEKLINEVMKSDYNFSPAYITLAYIQYILLDFNGSVRLAYKVIEQGRDKVDLSNYVRALLLVAGAKGMIAHYGGSLSKAINGTKVMPNLRKAKKLKPDSAGVTFGLGSYYLLAPALAGKDLVKAEEYLKRTIEIDPLFADAYVRLAQLYKLKGEKEKFQKYLSYAQDIDPGNELAQDIQSGECRFICVGGKY